ncbi:YlmC/YmxH family sporulation protein [Melghirimyces profundicolus]|uniref:YlmC/YmxH family sporulation protein n=1 Tax=Melghirimyces profundicolus TaxID=1242148 RepID=A0A2T6BRG1_9BACL|nr:YlmC/YmxH family sporulation protein [Melghirimyces profundicolus]PTX58634.1 YlmC/YmxH family sporulation protein [Melghirimyces profundicolus]
MRWSEFAEKELIDVGGGERIGSVGQADLLIDPETGEIRSMLLPVGSSWFGKRQEVREVIWSHIKKIGPEMVIVERGNGFFYK